MSKNNFIPLKVAINNSDKVKYIYIKKHIEKKESQQDKTLFVLNLTYDCTEKDVRHIFDIYGEIKEVHFDTLVNTQGNKDFANGGFCHVVFAKKKDLTELLNNPKTNHVHTAEKGSLRGIKKWMKEYDQTEKIDSITLQEKVRVFMKDFDLKKIEADKQAAESFNEMTADGFIQVKKRGGKKNSDGEISVGVASGKLKKQKDKALPDFYKFQQRQEKRERIADLRDKFEEDKKRIEKMRQQRKFKPY